MVFQNMYDCKENYKKYIKIIKIVKCLIPFTKMVSPNFSVSSHFPLKKSARVGKVNEICYCDIFVAQNFL